MFEIKANTKVKVIKDHAEWYAPNFKDHVTKTCSLFDTHEICVDPTGIATWCCVPGSFTIGSAWAEAGWYGFARDGWVLLARASDVTYLD